MKLDEMLIQLYGIFYLLDFDFTLFHTLFFFSTKLGPVRTVEEEALSTEFFKR